MVQNYMNLAKIEANRIANLFFDSYSTIYRRIKEIYPYLGSAMYYFVDGLYQLLTEESVKEGPNRDIYYDFELIMKWRNTLSCEISLDNILRNQKSETDDLIGTLNYYAEEFSSNDPDIRKNVASLIEKAVDASFSSDGASFYIGLFDKGNYSFCKRCFAGICDLRDSFSFSNGLKTNHVQKSASMYRLLKDSSLKKSILNDAKSIEVENKEDYKKINGYCKKICRHLGAIAKGFKCKWGGDDYFFGSEKFYDEEILDYVRFLNRYISSSDKEDREGFMKRYILGY